MRKVKGFTLMEVIGVMAVIAIIASVATPRIFGAIQDAKVTAQVQEINKLKTAIAAYYKDTGRYPRHVPSHADELYHNLMVNPSAAPIAGWNGPYLEAELTNQIVRGGYQDVDYSNSSVYACDLDGNGVQDGTFAFYRFDGVSDSLAEKISNAVDQDGGVTSGDKSWKKAGRIRRYNGDHTSIVIACLARV